MYHSTPCFLTWARCFSSRRCGGHGHWRSSVGRSPSRQSSGRCWLGWAGPGTAAGKALFFIVFLLSVRCLSQRYCDRLSDPDAQRDWAVRLRESLTSLGPAFVKGGQARHCRSLPCCCPFTALLLSFRCSAAVLSLSFRCRCPSTDLSLAVHCRRCRSGRTSCRRPRYTSCRCVCVCVCVCV